jgi:hypothetical protein
MAPKLKVDEVSPPPARLSAFLYHTPHLIYSLILFLSTTILLVYGAYTNLGISADLVDFSIVGLMAFFIPVLLVSYLVSQISWL